MANPHALRILAEPHFRVARQPKQHIQEPKINRNIHAISSFPFEAKTTVGSNLGEVVLETSDISGRKKTAVHLSPLPARLGALPYRGGP